MDQCLFYQSVECYDASIQHLRPLHTVTHVHKSIVKLIEEEWLDVILAVHIWIWIHTRHRWKAVTLITQVGNLCGHRDQTQKATKTAKNITGLAPSFLFNALLGRLSLLLLSVFCASHFPFGCPTELKTCADVGTSHSPDGLTEWKWNSILSLLHCLYNSNEKCSWSCL